jgi:cysteine synthase A
MRYLILCLGLCIPLAAHAGNIKDTDLISSNTFFLPPSTETTVFVQAHNASDNQDVTLHDLGARLMAKGYQVIVVAPSDMPEVRRANLETLGVSLVLTDPVELMSGAIAKADEIARGGAFVLHQFSNGAAALAHRATADEIWAQTGGAVDAFVAGVGTGATITGCAEVLKERSADIRIVAVEPAESPVLSGGKPGPHRITGIGPGFVPQLLRRDLIDEVYPVPWWEAHEAIRELGRQVGLFFGPSTGAVLIAARAQARILGEGKRVVGIAADWGERNVGVLMEPP